MEWNLFTICEFENNKYKYEENKKQQNSFLLQLIPIFVMLRLVKQ